MKPISSVTIFLCSSSRRLFTRAMPPALFTSESETLAGISHFSTSSPDSSSSAKVRVSVWWDFDNCSVPSKADGHKITRCITAAVRANEIKGPIQITAFGDVFQLSKSNQEVLPYSGIKLIHIPHGGNNCAYRSIVFDLMYWVSQNPPPAHLFLISGNSDFASYLHHLRKNNYNILLASTDDAPAVLCSAASIMWQWTSLVKGGNLSGRHFNQPPDFPFAYWYGHYRAPLEDPFAVSNQTSCLQSEEGSDLNSETKVRPSTKDAVPVMDYKENGGQNACKEEKVSSPSKLNVPKLSTNSEEPPPEKQEEPHKVQEQPCVIEKAKEGELSLDQSHPIEMREAIPEVGILKKIWRKWFRGDDDYQEKISHSVNEKVNPDVQCVQLTGQSSDTGKLPPSSISTNEVITDAEIKCTESVDKFGKPRGGIFNQIVRWCKFWKSENSDNLNAEHSKSVEEVSSRLEMQEVFTESFWNYMLVYLGTPEGSAAILQSKTRQEMVQILLRLGPPHLQSLNKTHISHLIDLLISEKKWLTEHPSQTFPFKLTVPTKPTSSTKPFNSKQPTKDNNPTIPVKKNISPQTRTKILSECQKLLNEVVKEYPNGTHTDIFKKLFLCRYGYNLKVQQLGYHRIETFLQIMPGVKIESNYILPSGDHKRGVEDNDSQWEESGPISRMNTKKDDHGFEMSDNDLSYSKTERLENGSKRGG